MILRTPTNTSGRRAGTSGRMGHAILKGLSDFYNSITSGDAGCSGGSLQLFQEFETQSLEPRHSSGWETFAVA